MKHYYFQLDFPPSINTYYRMYQGKYLLSAKGREFKLLAAKQIKQNLGSIKPLSGRIRISIGLSRHDNRDYDIDNYVKGVLDAIKGIVFVDDRQMDELHVKRLPITPGQGYIEIIVEETTPYKKPKDKKKFTVKRKSANPWKNL